MKPQKSFRRVQLLAVAALMGAGLLALMLVMVSLTGVSVAAGLAAAPSGFVNIGDYVWYDANANGSFSGGSDTGEGQYIGGINGVHINLYKDLDGNGQIDPGEFLKSTVTGLKPSTPGSKGWYEFADVPTGAVYLVQIDPSNFAPGGALVGMALTSAGTIGSEPREVDIPLTPTTTFLNVDFGYVESGVTVEKRLITQGPIYPGNSISFQIIITNRGKLALTTVPLWDYYGPACLKFVNAVVAQSTHDAGLGILHWNDVGPLNTNQSKTVTVNFTAGSAANTTMYWKEGGWPDYAPKGLPDFSQKQDAWGQAVGQPAVWRWSHCGPVAAANSLWWFDSRFETGTTPPPAISDSYKLVKSYAVTPNVWDDHSPRNVEPLVNALATQMGTNPATGTTVANLAAGISQYITNSVGVGQYTVTKKKAPTFTWVADEVRRSEDVILLLGFYQYYGTQPNVTPFRIGGHYVTVAGVNVMTPTIAFSDPYTDRAELGQPGRVIPNPHLSLHSSAWTTDTLHNDAAILSHDTYLKIDTNTPGGVWGPSGYIMTCAEANAFVGQNEGDVPNAPIACNNLQPVITEVEYAVAVSPSPVISQTVRCDPTVNIAVASGVVDALNNELPAVQDETPVRIQEPNAVGLRSLQASGQNAVGVLAAALVGTAVVGWGMWSVRRRRAER